MQKPLAADGIAWCSPPTMFAARRTSLLHTALAASTLAPTMCADASCIPAKEGQSGVPRP
jgi:hypothetical protein